MEVCPVFVDETGILTGSVHQQPVYGIGLLVVPNTREITDSFYRIHFNFFAERASERKRARRNILAGLEPPSIQTIDLLMHSTRHHEYKFANISRFNVQQYIDLLNVYFSFPNLEFHALLMDRTEPEAGLDRWNNDDWEAYAYLTRELLASALTRDVFAIVDLQGKPNRSKVYLEDVLCSIDPVKGCLRATSDMSIYLQLVDILLGCVQFDFKDRTDYYSKGSKKSEEKRHIVNFIKSRLGMKRTEAFLPGDQSFNSWGAPSLFTVRKGAWRT